MFPGMVSRPTLPMKTSSVVGSRAYSSQKAEPPKIRHILLVAILGSVGFVLASNSLDRKKPAKEMSEQEYQQIKEASRQRFKKQAFDSNQVSVVFVLGGPGSGKGTQCQNIVRDYKFAHLSAGDLLREEQKNPQSKYGELIANYIREGQIVPMEITIALLKNAMKEQIDTKGVTKFLIDGFPRKMDQALKFEEDVAVSQFTLFFECPESVMLERLLERGQNSGRTDDNVESIKKRFRVFVDTSMPVVEYFRTSDKVETVSCQQPKEKVYEQVKDILSRRGLDK